MHFDERALLLEQAHRSFTRPRRTAWLDGPIWWIGPLAILAAIAMALALAPWPQSSTIQKRPDPVVEPAEPAPAFAWSSTRISKN